MPLPWRRRRCTRETCRLAYRRPYGRRGEYWCVAHDDLVILNDQRF